MKMRVLIGLVALATMTLFFQNCGPVQFLKSDSNGALVAAAATDGTSGTINPPETSNQTTPGVEPLPPGRVPSSEVEPKKDPKSPCKHRSDDDDDRDRNSDDHDLPDVDSKEPKSPCKHGSSDDDDKKEPKSKEPAESDKTYQCIIKDHGKSSHIQFQSDALTTGTGNKQTVCMSENACLNIASEIFEVVGVNHSDPCAHSPNEVDMSDTDVTALVIKKKE